MSNYDNNHSYGAAVINTAPFTTGKVFYVGTSSAQQAGFIPSIATVDPDGTQRLFNTITLAVAQAVSGRGDKIVVLPSYGVVSAAELLLCEANGVSVYTTGPRDGNGMYVDRATATLPATALGSIFTITGRVKITAIIGEVTTAISAGACTLKITNTPTVGNAVDLCSATSIASAAVGTELTITGTFATGLVVSFGASVYQAAPTLAKAGTIDITTSGTNTGSVKWKVYYEPIDAGSYISAF